MKQRNKLIALAAITGQTYRSIAEEHNLTVERIRQITSRVVRTVSPEIWGKAKVNRKTFDTKVIRRRAAYLVPAIHNWPN